MCLTFFIQLVHIKVFLKANKTNGTKMYFIHLFFQQNEQYISFIHEQQAIYCRFPCQNFIICFNMFFFLLFYLAPLWGTPLEAIANNALHFLFDRVTYWDRLGPLPPPPPPRKAKSKMSGSTMSLDSVLTVNTSNSKITTNSSYIFVDKKPVPTYRRRNSQVNIQLDPSKLNFNFKSVQSQREIRKMSRIPEDNELFTDSPSGFGDATPESAGQSITDYIKKELEHISEGLLASWDILVCCINLRNTRTKF